MTERRKKRRTNSARAARVATIASVASVASVALALASSSARADVTKAQCIEANTKGQDLRRDGNLAAARDVFRTCAVPSCPALLRDDCTRRIDEIERVQPTIVFDAKDASGRDVSVVKVTIDGKPLTDRLAGTPLQVDPGEHVFAFQVPGQAPVTQTFIIKENERDRRERVVLGGPAPGSSIPSPASRATGSSADAATAVASPGSSSSGELPSHGAMSTRKILGLTAAGVGVAGVAVGSVFGLMTRSEISQQKSDCASPTQCSNPTGAASAHSTGSSDGAISTVAFIAGGALLAAGAVLFFTGGHAPDPTATTGLVVTPSVGPGGGGLSLKGGF
jgi:hypothetical protein